MDQEQVCKLLSPTKAFPSNEVMESPVLTAEVDNWDDENCIIGPTPEHEHANSVVPTVYERPQQSHRLAMRRGTPNRLGMNPIVDPRRRRREPTRNLRESFSSFNFALAYVTVKNTMRTVYSKARSRLSNRFSPMWPTSPGGGGDFTTSEEGQTPGFTYFTILGLILGLIAALLVHHTFNPDRFLRTTSQPEGSSYNIQNSQPQSSPTQVDTPDDRIIIKECPNWRSKVLLKSCQTKSSEYSRKIQVLQEQLSNLQHKFIEALDEKEIKMDKLVSAVKDFKQSHYYFHKDSITALIRNAGITLFAVYTIHVTINIYRRFF